MTENLGIQRIASIHVFVRDLERSRDHYVQKLDFVETAVSTREFEQAHRARASVVEAGGARFVFMEPLGLKGESYHWLAKHPEGIGRIVFDVDDAERAFDILRRRKATPVTGLERSVVEGNQVTWFDITTAFGDTLFRFVSRKGDGPSMPGLKRVETGVSRNCFGIRAVDHITSNFLTLQPALAWMEQVMGLERYWEIEFHTQDVKAGHLDGSGLKSVVMVDRASGIKFANNEPAAPNFRASQIYTFCEEHGGPGVQHLAVTVDDIVTAVEGMRSRGLEFMPTPGTYYDMLPERLERCTVGALEEDTARLRELEILADGSAPGEYLLQVFVREAEGLFRDRQAGPFFLELIQRKGDRGFGAGNFRALFESIERQQQLDGC